MQSEHVDWLDDRKIQPLQVLVIQCRNYMLFKYCKFSSSIKKESFQDDFLRTYLVYSKDEQTLLCVKVNMTVLPTSDRPSRHQVV